MKILLENYEKRITNFIINLAQKPIIVKKYKNKQLTSREEYYAKNTDKIIDKKGFSFNYYKTEKQRIGEYINEKKAIDNYTQNNSKQKRKKSSKIKLIQPSMRFKARTDLERVYDILKTSGNIYKDKKLVQNQLDKLGFLSKNIEEYKEDDYDDRENEDNKNINEIINEEEIIDLNEEDKKKKILHNKIIQDRKNMIKRRKLLLSLENSQNVKKNDNEENKHIHHLREDLHQKFHFKALENLSMFETATMNHNFFKIWSKEDIETQKNITFNKNLYYASLSNGFNNTKQNTQRINSYNYKRDKSINTNNNNSKEFNDKKHKKILYNIKKMYNKRNSEIFNNKKNLLHQKNYNIFNNKKILEDMELTKEVVNSNPLLYNYNFNKGKNENNNKVNISNNKINNLIKIAFVNHKDDSETFISKNDFLFDDSKKEENIVIDGKQYKKGENYIIADKILKKSNWYNNKVKYNGNFGKGKLMFTNGLTLKEFEEKYGILP